MKKLIILFCFLPFFALAQKLPDFGFDKVRIVQPDKIIQAETKPVSSDPDIEADRYYYWYGANVIHATQGGFSGKLLNGLYTEFYVSKNLETQGTFKKGLKDGAWKTWNEDGTLSSTVLWRNGLVLPTGIRSFWDKINIFKHKAKHPVADTVNRKNN